jgi:hypothetical protein
MTAESTEIRKVHMLVRQIQLPNRSVVAVPVAVYDDFDEARRQMAEKHQGLLALVQQARLVLPSAGNAVVDTGLALKEFLAELGIAGWDHYITSTPVMGTIQIFAPGGKLVLPQ